MRNAITTLSVSVGLVAIATFAAAAPKMVIEEALRDCGQVAQGSVVELAYEIANQGDEPLAIELRPTCGCTVADYDRTIAPGRRGVVRVSFDTAGLAGRVTKPILILGNDPERPTARLVLQAEVLPVLEVLPRPLLRLQTEHGTAASASVLLVTAPGGAESFAISSIDTGSEHVESSLRALADDELVAGRGPSQYEITISLSADAPLGMHSNPVVVHTDHPLASTIQIKLLAMVTS